jgi:hypothetical protein
LTTRETRSLGPDVFRVLPAPSIVASCGVAVFLGVDELLPRIAMIAAGPPVAAARLRPTWRPAAAIVAWRSAATIASWSSDTTIAS